MNYKELNYLVKNNISIDLNNCSGMQILHLIKRVIGRKGLIKVRYGNNNKGIIDLTTANTINNVYENLSPEHQQKLLRMFEKRGYPDIANLCFKLIERCSI